MDLRAIKLVLTEKFVFTILYGHAFYNESAKHSHYVLLFGSVLGISKIFSVMTTELFEGLLKSLRFIGTRKLSIFSNSFCKILERIFRT